MRRLPARHPGEVLKTDFLVPQGLFVSDAARLIGVTERTLWALVEGEERLSQHLARRIARLFGTTRFWLDLQAAWDREQADRKEDEEARNGGFGLD